MRYEGLPGDIYKSARKEDRFRKDGDDCVSLPSEQLSQGAACVSVLNKPQQPQLWDLTMRKVHL